MSKQGRTDAVTPRLAAYIHFPWCLQKCPYCDFATEAIAPREIPHEAYASAVCREVTLRAPAFASAGPLGTVFFGGGTPSVWEPAQLGRVLAALKAEYGEPDEVTVECNPNSLDVDRATALRDVGVTRLSIGVQSLREPHLRYLGRMHDATEALRAVRAAASVPGLRLSADVMFGMPDQREDELLADVNQLLEAGARHLSAYALTIEPATRFGELARKGRLPRLPEDDVATLFTALATTLTTRGLEHYEVSNYAMPGEAARHNQAYWQGAPYLGIGAAAVGCWRTAPGDATRYRNTIDPVAYMAALQANTLPPDEREALDGDTIVREGLMLGLRTDVGVDLVALAQSSGVDPLRGRERAIERSLRAGDVVRDGESLRIPHERWLMADGIVASVF